MMAGWSRWSTREHAARERFDAWATALQETHLSWALTRPLTRDVHAELTRGTLGAARLVHCTCDPVSGARTRSEIAQTGEPWFGIVLVLDGAEQVAAGDTSLVLRPGQLALWDSEQPLRFALAERLSKVSLLVPKARFERIVQGAAIGDVVSADDSAASALVVAQLRALAQHGWSLTEEAGERVLDASLELLGAAFGERKLHATSRFDAVRTWVLAHLDDPELLPAAIARAHHVSVRTLHAWFHAEGLSVSRFVLSARLERCRRDLLRRDGAHVTEIAFRWGFNDVAYFSRAFKRAYGVAPRAFRDGS